MEALTHFLQQQKLLQIAPAGGSPWIANVYMGCESPRKLFFIGSTETMYGQLLEENGELAFATAWHDEDNHKNRKGVQGVGRAVVAADEHEIALGVKLHNQNYPEFADRISKDYINDPTNHSKVWVISPTYIKFWNDELYGDDEAAEFHF